MKTLILGSTSPFRKTLLEKLNLPFDCAKPEIDESPKPDESPEQLVTRLSIEKAKSCATHFDNALIISSDQVAVYHDQILGKPHTVENAIKQLQTFSGKQVIFLTGLTVLDTDSGRSETLIEPFTVHFKDLSLNDISNYVEKEMPLNCAGSFKSEGLGICLFKKLSGDDPNSLIGLPLIKLTELLAKFGLNVLDHQ